MSEDISTELKQDWYFTLVGDRIGQYVVIHGTMTSAREEMFKRFGRQWGFQYPDAEAAGVDKYNLSLAD